MDNPRKILIIQLKRAGDVIVTTPIAPLLKKRWPGARVDFLVDRGFASVLENNPAIDQIQLYDKTAIIRSWKRIRAERYDLILDFQSSPRSALVSRTSGATLTAGYRVPFWGRFYDRTIRRPGSQLTVVGGKVSLAESVAGPLGTVPEPQMFLSSEEQTWGRSVLETPVGQTIIGLIPTHRHVSRRWEGSSFAALSERLHQSGHAVWLFWGPGEREYIDEVARQAPHARVIPSTTFRQMAALMARCQLIVSNDNGPMHIAAAVGVPTVTIYGPTDPFAWNPGGSRHTAIQANALSCLKCNLNVCPFAHECMTQVTPDQVFSAVESLYVSA